MAKVKEFKIEVDRPENYKGMKVPKVLLSGNDKEIQKWNDEKSIERTKLLRPNLFDND